MDKWLRIAAGIVLLALGLFGPLGWWGAIGVVPLATGLVGNCPFAASLLSVRYALRIDPAQALGG